jgi:transposase
MSVAAPMLLRSGDDSELSTLVRSSTVEAGLAQRARIVLLAAQGMSNTAIALAVGVSRPTVILWRNRYLEAGMAGLGDLARSGRPPVIDDLAVVVETLAASPAYLGVTHWSARLLAQELGISFASVARIWRENDLKPWKRETFKFSTDPELDAKVRDVVGLYLNPPEKAVVVCVDEKTQIQAVDRTAPILPLRPGLPEKATSDYVRHGTTSLFAALEVATGKVTDACYQRHTHAEFLDFLKKVAKAHPRVKLHVVADNYSTHKHANVKAWLQANPRVTMHFTPTSGSWMNMVEIFFGVISRQAIRRGTFTSVKELIHAIETFINGWNDRCGPFIWTKTADDVLARAKPRQKTSDTRH